MDAFFHQILNTPDVRDRAIDFLVLNYPRASKDSKIVEKLLMVRLLNLFERAWIV